MQYNNNVVTGLKIAYIGGGSRGWAWGLMSDLASCDDINGDVYLYDIDMEAAKNNEVIGNKFNLYGTTTQLKLLKKLLQVLTSSLSQSFQVHLMKWNQTYTYQKNTASTNQ